VQLLVGAVPCVGERPVREIEASLDEPDCAHGLTSHASHARIVAQADLIPVLDEGQQYLTAPE
jgi:hypothetical protein